MHWVFSSLVKDWTRAVVTPPVQIATRLGDAAASDCEDNVLPCGLVRTNSEVHGRNWNLRVGFLQRGKPPLKSRPVTFRLLTTHYSTTWFLFLLWFFFHVLPNFLFSSASASLLFPVTKMRRSLLSPTTETLGSQIQARCWSAPLVAFFCDSDDELRVFQSWTCYILV